MRTRPLAMTETDTWFLVVSLGWLLWEKVEKDESNPFPLLFSDKIDDKLQLLSVVSI